MTAFTDRLDSIYTITNRPDLVADTKRMVKAATLKAHSSDFYPKDLFEVALAFEAPAYLQEFEYRTHVPRWRALKYLRKYDFANDSPLEFFEIVTPEQVLDSYKVQKENVLYLAGEVIKIRSYDMFDYAILSCYVHPDVTEDTYSSWVASEYPQVIDFEAASMIFKMIGHDEMASFYTRESAILLAEMKNSNILLQGY